MWKKHKVLFAFVSAVVITLGIPAVHANAQNSPTITEFQVPRARKGNLRGRMR